MKKMQQPLISMMNRAQKDGYALGAFNCRYPQMIRAVLEAAEEARSPVAIEIAPPELHWFAVEMEEFTAEIERSARDARIGVPFAVHLDHTTDPAVIRRAIANNFTSVMIDASAHPLEKNIAITRDVVEFAHRDGVGVEAELGKIASADKLETQSDETLYTEPAEAKRFVAESGCDLLAVSVGSAHGVYAVKNPRIDYERLREIREVVSIPLVLHGGTGLPAETVQKAIHVEGGGISKMNIATELELTLLATLGIKQRMTPAEVRAISADEEKRIRQALKKVITEKMRVFLGSAGKA